MDSVSQVLFDGTAMSMDIILTVLSIKMPGLMIMLPALSKLLVLF
jgi:hypothetical protein